MALEHHWNQHGCQPWQLVKNILLYNCIVRVFYYTKFMVYADLWIQDVGHYVCCSLKDYNIASTLSQESVNQWRLSHHVLVFRHSSVLSLTSGIHAVVYIGVGVLHSVYEYMVVVIHWYKDFQLYDRVFSMYKVPQQRTDRLV